jgi:hypothetical protein
MVGRKPRVALRFTLGYFRFLPPGGEMPAKACLIQGGGFRFVIPHAKKIRTWGTRDLWCSPELFAMVKRVFPRGLKPISISMESMYGLNRLRKNRERQGNIPKNIPRRLKPNSSSSYLRHG